MKEFFFRISRIHRRTLLNTIQLRVEIRYDAPPTLPTSTTGSTSNISNINVDNINRFQAQYLLADFANLPGVTPLSLSVQEQQNQTTMTLGIISRLVLVTPPSS